MIAALRHSQRIQCDNNTHSTSRNGRHDEQISVSARAACLASANAELELRFSRPYSLFIMLAALRDDFVPFGFRGPLPGWTRAIDLLLGLQLVIILLCLGTIWLRFRKGISRLYSWVPDSYDPLRSYIVPGNVCLMLLLLLFEGGIMIPYE